MPKQKQNASAFRTSMKSRCLPPEWHGHTSVEQRRPRKEKVSDVCEFMEDPYVLDEFLQ